MTIRIAAPSRAEMSARSDDDAGVTPVQVRDLARRIERRATAALLAAESADAAKPRRPAKPKQKEGAQ